MAFNEHSRARHAEIDGYLYALPANKIELESALMRIFPTDHHSTALTEVFCASTGDLTYQTPDNRLRCTIHDLPSEDRDLLYPDHTDFRHFSRQERTTHFGNTLLALYLHGCNPAESAKGRKDGTPFVSHLIRVREHCLKYAPPDIHTASAAILHDSIEDTPATLDHIFALCGPEVARAVGYVTKIKRHHNDKANPLKLMEHLTLSALCKTIDMFGSLEDTHVFQAIQRDYRRVRFRQRDVARFRDLDPSAQNYILKRLDRIGNQDTLYQTLTEQQLLSCSRDSSPFSTDTRAFYMKQADVAHNSQSFIQHGKQGDRQKVLKKIRYAQTFYANLTEQYGLDPTLRDIILQNCDEQQARIQT